jgi:hypothetical protein
VDWRRERSVPYSYAAPVRSAYAAPKTSGVLVYIWPAVNQRTRPFLLTHGARECAQGLPYLSRNHLSVKSPATSMITQIKASAARVCPRRLASERKNRLPMTRPIRYTRTKSPTSTPQQTKNGREAVTEEIFQAANEGADNRVAEETYKILLSPVTTKRSTTNFSRLVDASCKR